MYSKTPYPLNDTYLTERNEETLSSGKTYKAYWRRAFSKIRINRLLQKLCTHSGDFELLNRLSELTNPQPVKKSLNHFIILPYSYKYLTWILFLFLCLVYLCTYGIFFFSFYPYDNESRETLMESLLDIIFIIDVIISLNLAYFNEFNNLITKRSKIWKNYSKDFLILDLISALPLGIILRSFPHKEFSIIFMLRHIPKLLKWFKIRGSIKNFSFLKNIDYIQTLYKLELFIFKLVFLILLGIHLIACIFYLVARAENFSYDTWITSSGLINDSVEVKYLTSLYWALSTLVSLGYGDIHPYTQLETGVCLIWEILSVFLISYSISSLTIIYNESNKLTIQLEENLYFAEQFSMKCDLPKTLRKRLKLVIHKKKLIKTKHSLKKLFDSIDPNLKHEIALNMFQKALTKIEFFSNKSQFFLSTVPFWLDFLQFNPNEYLFHASSASESLFFLVTGRVRLFYRRTLFYVCKEGETLGDLEVFSRKERRFDAICVEFCKVFRIFHKDLMKIEQNFPEEFEELLKARKKRKEVLAHHLAEMISLKNYQNDPLNGISCEIVLREKERLRRNVFSFKDDSGLSTRVENSLVMLAETEDCIKNCEKLFGGVLIVEDLLGL